jgi:hypothetical protein
MVKSLGKLYRITSYSLSIIKYNEEKNDGLDIEIEHLNFHFSSLIISKSSNILNEYIFETNLTIKVNEILKSLINKIYEKKFCLISAGSLDNFHIDKGTFSREKILNQETKLKKPKISREIIHHTLTLEINSLRRKIEIKDHELNYLKAMGSNTESSKFCALLTSLHKRDYQIQNNEREINFQVDEIQGLKNQLSTVTNQLSEIEKLAVQRATQISNLKTNLDSLKIKKDIICNTKAALTMQMSHLLSDLANIKVHATREKRDRQHLILELSKLRGYANVNEVIKQE